MKLASLREGRDGALIVVDRELSRAVRVPYIAPTMQAALDEWHTTAPKLQAVYDSLSGGADVDAFALQQDRLAAPLPRAYQFVDGSAYLAHVERVRRARGAEMPPSFLTDPLMYQAVSDHFLGPCDDVAVASEDYGIDFESEVGVITDDVPMAVSAAQAAHHVKLLCLINDVSLRNLIPAELGKQFGFLQGKPRSALSPVFVTPDELGDAWRDCKVHLPLITTYNGEWFGNPECGEDMQFDFCELIAHAAKTRPLSAGTIVGSGTIANQDLTRGSSCLAEKRVLEVIEHGAAETPFMRFGDAIRIEMLDRDGNSIFGAIEQRIVPREI